MNCAQANQLDIVNWLSLQGYEPQKIIGADYWYRSPLREEETASFKVNRNINAWYDHGIGKGGTLIDLAKIFYNCNTSEALGKISSFQQQKISTKNSVHPKENGLNNGAAIHQQGILILSATQPVKDIALCNYALKRNIAMEVLNNWCYEVRYMLNEKEYKAIGFKNNAGGYELRNAYFKGSSSSKFISYTNNSSKHVTVFEGFFDLLAHQSLAENKGQLTNMLVLNSLAFFDRSLLLMEKHEQIKLYLDNDAAGKKYTSMALKRSPKFSDESNAYKCFKDLSEWLEKKINTTSRHSMRRGL